MGMCMTRVAIFTELQGLRGEPARVLAKLHFPEAMAGAGCFEYAAKSVSMKERFRYNHPKRCGI